MLAGKGDLTEIPGKLRAKQTPEWDQTATLAEGGMRHIERDMLLLEAPDDDELDRAYAALKRLHGDAFGWDPPDVQGLERLGATRMRQYVRSWINEWDLVRLDPDFRPESEAVSITSNYSEDLNLEIHLREPEDPALRLARAKRSTLIITTLLSDCVKGNAMLKPADMFDRDREWSQLTDFIGDTRPGATLGVVSGRRRQGKSFLLEAACQEAGGFYFSAQEATEAESLSLIGVALTRYLDPVAPITPTDWPTVIDVLLRLGRERHVPVVIDEFPYLARVSPALPSMIQAAYAPRRDERSQSRTRLLLCGSALSFMGKLLSGSAPLRGRASLDLTVQTLDYRQAAQFWQLADPRLAVLVHAVVGGTPAYRTEMMRYDAPRDLSDFDDWVTRTVLSPGSPMFLEARYLLAEEPDLRDTALYHSVLAAIAVGNSRRGAIAAHVGRNSNELSHPLTVLEDAGLIVRENDAFRGNRTDYGINEPLLAFYHAIMRPLWPQLLRGGRAAQLWESSQRRFASKILGPHFERTCREWSLYFAGDTFGDLPVQVTAGTVNDPAKKTMCQVDVAAIGHVDSGRPPLLAIGEAKWNEVMGLRHLERLRRIRELLMGSDKLDTSRTRLVCFSGAGFTDDLKEFARHGEVHLVGLHDLYGSL